MSRHERYAAAARRDRISEQCDEQGATAQRSLAAEASEEGVQAGVDGIGHDRLHARWAANCDT